MKFNLLGALAKATQEDEVKVAYIKYFNINFSCKNKNDCRCPGILFEFKHKKRLSKKGQGLAQVIAQGFYYIHRVLYGQVVDTIDNFAVPKYLVVANEKEAAILNTADWKDIFSVINYDWRRAPSSPDMNMDVDDKISSLGYVDAVESVSIMPVIAKKKRK